MNKLFFYTAIISLLVFYSCKAQQKKTVSNANDLTIAFYNTENLFDIFDNPKTHDEKFTPSGENHWTSERYHKKIKNIAWVISSINKGNFPTLIGLSEVENKKVLEDLISQKSLKSANYSIIHEDDYNMTGIDIALLYNNKYFTYISHKYLNVRSKERRERRILYVKGKFGNEVFHIFVNHWKSRRGGQSKTENRRIASAKVLRKKVDKIFREEKNANIIIMGDFNDTPTDISLNKIVKAVGTKNLQDAELYNLMYDKAKKGKGTNSYRYHWYMIDNLIVSKNLLTGNSYRVGEGQIFENKKLLYYNSKAGISIPRNTYGSKRGKTKYYGGYSDHLPVYFTLKKAK